VLAAGLGALLLPPASLTLLPPGVLVTYPLVMTAVLACYALWLRHRVSLAIAGLVLVAWLSWAAWQGYSLLRHLVLGLDYLALSLGLFVLALLISLGKSGLLARWLSVPRRQSSQAAD
jgi:hypothetical protein